MELIERIDAARERWNVLEHPFYKRWSCGELTRDELAHYAGEYRHAVVALAETAAKSGHAEHAREEAEHVALWDEFAAAFDADTIARAEPRDRRVRAGLDRSGEPARGACGHVRDRGRPAGGLQAKLDGLREHYGVADDEPGAAVLRASLGASTTSTPPNRAASSSPTRPTATPIAWSRWPRPRSGATGHCSTESKPGGKPDEVASQGPSGAPAAPVPDRRRRSGPTRSRRRWPCSRGSGVSEHNTATAWWLALIVGPRRHLARRRSPASPTGSTSSAARRSGAPQRPT